MSVTRYKVEELECCFQADMIESPTGEYVLHSDYARLKAEVERLNGVIKEVVKEAQENSDRYVRRLKEEAAHPACVAMNRKLGDANNQIHRLKAEVERLEGLVKYWQIEAETDHAHWVRHAETNERLRKAGDAMADAMERNGCDPLGCHEENKDAVKAWLAAKEGKQP